MKQVSTTLTKTNKNPLLQYPPKIPQLGINLQGPIFKNFEIAKQAEAKDSTIVVQNNFPFKTSSCAARQSRIIFCGMLSRKGSEKNNRIYLLYIIQPFTYFRRYLNIQFLSQELLFSLSNFYLFSTIQCKVFEPFSLGSRFEVKEKAKFETSASNVLLV